MGAGEKCCKLNDKNAMNAFCASLDEQDRMVLCAHCSERCFVRHYVQFKEDHTSGLYIVLEGLFVAEPLSDDIDLLENQKPGFALALPGSVLLGDLLLRTSNNDVEDLFASHDCNHIKAITQVRAAFIPLADALALYRKSIGFVKQLFKATMVDYLRIREFSAIFRCHDLGKQVRYVLHFASTHNFDLTHQDIADILGRNRSSVSRTVSLILGGGAPF